MQPYVLRQSQAEGWDPRRKKKNKKLTKSWFSLCFSHLLGLFYVALDHDYPMSKESCKHIL